MPLIITLSGRKTLDILVSLSSGPNHIRGLQRKIGGSLSTVEERVESLIKEGLVVQIGDSSPSRMLELTDKGKTITAYLMAQERQQDSRKVLSPAANWILVLLYGLGRIKGSTRLEKMLFLLKERFSGIKGQYYSFVPQTYGPYSEQALIDAQILQNQGLVSITDEPFVRFDPGDVVIRKDYDLTDEGRKKAELIFNQVKDDAGFIEIVTELQGHNSASLNVLLKYVHEKWPQYSKN
jgi:DNA-binding HxlR family transcriptional regulator